MSGPTKDQLSTENVALKRQVGELNEALNDGANEREQMTNTIMDLKDEVQRLHSEFMIISRQPGASEPMEQQIGQDGVVAMDSETGELEKPSIANPDTPDFDDKARYEQFMNEDVTVMIQSTNEKHEQLIFEISVNGQREIFKKGETKTIKRRFVEGLARAKPMRFRNEEYINRDGIRAVRWPTTSGLRFPFSVVQDPNPLGPSWLRAVLAQP